MTTNNRFTLTRKRGARNVPQIEFVAPDDTVAFRAACEHPPTLVGLLEECGGDVDAFIRLFTVREETQISILTRVLFILGRPENTNLFNEWNGLIAAHKRAKVLIAERRAFDFIASYNLSNKGKKPSTTQYVTIARFWLAGHTAGETTKAKRAANTDPVPQEGDAMEKIMSSLMDKETDDSSGNAEVSSTDY